ncbi:DegT/DnrJ/EryC1/StrS family aminotransferase [Chloroflexota bacterium]
MDHAIGVSDGTTALQWALMLCAVVHGDKLITVSHTCFSAAEAIAPVGARPIFVGVDPGTYAMDVTQIEALITDGTQAVEPVHLCGKPAAKVQTRTVPTRARHWSGHSPANLLPRAAGIAVPGL